MATSLTSAQISKMTPPMLRKTVKDLGGDPATMGNSNPAKMKEWLLKKVAAPAKGAPPKPAAKPAAGKPAPVAAKPAPKAAPAPTKPAVVAKKPPTTAPATPAQSSKPSASGTTDDPFIRDLFSKVEEMELRLQACESGLGISNATATPPEMPPADRWASLKDFFTSEDGGEPQLNVGSDDIQSFNAQQCADLAEMMGVEKPAKELRALKAQLVEALDALTTETEGEEEAEEEVEEEEEATPPAKKGPGRPAAAPAAAKFKVGQLVAATYEGEAYDPCKITKVAEGGRGKVVYTIDILETSDQNGGEDFEVAEADIKGPAKNKAK